MEELVRKQIKLAVKSVDDDGTFEGYCSVFGNLDSDNEVIDKGAFKRTLDHSKGVVPILWQHERKEPVGWNAEAEEDDHGLKIKGRLMIDTEDGRRARSFLKLGLELGGKPGLSIGFLVPKSGDYFKDGVRHFKEVALKEYSIVTFPANAEAAVTGAKGTKKTKRVDGVDLPASCFAYVGDPDKTETWKLPIKFPGDEEKTAAHIRNALARFSQTQGIPDDEKPAVLAKIKRAAKAAGIDAGKAEDFDSSLEEQRVLSALWDERRDLESALYDAIQDNRDDETLSADDKKANIALSLTQYAAAMADWWSRFIDATAPDEEEDDEDAEGKGLKAGKTISRATAKKLEAAVGYLKDSDMHAMRAKAARRDAIGVLRDVTQAYYSNDVNPPNPVGKEGDPEQLHSLLEAMGDLAKKIGPTK